MLLWFRIRVYHSLSVGILYYEYGIALLQLFSTRHILGFRICVMLSGSQTSLLDSVPFQLHATLE
ncbi:hypothetical protein, partial [Helicobacter bilis]|uniref:hypothetical protein n=1 Tax=Helicobacter bilis TaxID=37372 RepID=UPI001EE78A5A